MSVAMKHMDELHIPCDSITRGFVNMGLAMNQDPYLADLIREMYPMPEQVTS